MKTGHVEYASRGRPRSLGGRLPARPNTMPHFSPVSKHDYTVQPPLPQPPIARYCVFIEEKWNRIKLFPWFRNAYKDICPKEYQSDKENGSSLSLWAVVRRSVIVHLNMTNWTRKIEQYSNSSLFYWPDIHFNKKSIAQIVNWTIVHLTKNVTLSRTNWTCTNGTKVI